MSDQTVIQRLWLRYYGYSRFQGFRLPWGMNALSFAGNMRGFCLLSRHPRWSITWLWFIRVAPGRYGGEPHWKRIGLILAPHRAFRGIPAVLNLGFFHISIHTQDAMAARPGSSGYDRKQWVRYCERIAKRKAAAMAQQVYRAELARMLEPAP